MKGAAKTYEKLDAIRIPEPIPEIGVREGDVGVIDSVYDDGKMLHVEVSRTSDDLIALLDISTEPDLHVMGYSRLS